MPRLIFDIETIGENFDEMDDTTQHALTRWIEREAKDKAGYEKDLARVKSELGLSGLTGQIVALTGFACLMIATNVFNNVLEVELDEYLYDFREGQPLQKKG